MAGYVDAKTGAPDGSITKIAKDGSIVWSGQYGNPISGKEFSGLGKENDRFIFDECWGINSTSDGGAIWHAALAHIVTSLKITNDSLLNVLLIHGKSGEAC